MANRLQKIIYNLSIAAPILIVIAVLWLKQESNWTNPILISWKVPLILVVIAIGSIILFIISFNYGKKNLQRITVRVESLSSADGWLVINMVTYVLPIVSLKVKDYCNPLLAGVLVLVFIAAVFSDYITPNPWLYFRKYHFYKISVEGAAANYYLITKKKIRRSQEVIRVTQVFEFLLLRED